MLYPDQRALPFPELARQPTVYACSFILTNLDMSTPPRAVAAGNGGGAGFRKKP